MFTNSGASSAYENYPKLEIFTTQPASLASNMVEPGRLEIIRIVSAHNAIIIIQSLQPATILANYIIQDSELGNNF